MGALGERSSVAAPNVLYLESVEPSNSLRTRLFKVDIWFSTGFAWAESLLDTIRGKQCLDLGLAKLKIALINGGVHPYLHLIV